MTEAELIACIENPLVRAFLQEYLDEFVSDTLVFSEQILTHAPPEGKSFVQSAGLVFYSTPIVNFMPDLPWQTIKTKIANAVSDVFHMNANDHRYSPDRIQSTLDANNKDDKLIKQAIVAAFASICESAEDAMGTILIAGVAELLGKYIALHIAGILDEAAECQSQPMAQVSLTDLA